MIHDQGDRISNENEIHFLLKQNILLKKNRLVIDNVSWSNTSSVFGQKRILLLLFLT